MFPSHSEARPPAARPTTLRPPPHEHHLACAPPPYHHPHLHHLPHHLWHHHQPPPDHKTEPHPAQPHRPPPSPRDPHQEPPPPPPPPPPRSQNPPLSQPAQLTATPARSAPQTHPVQAPSAKPQPQQLPPPPSHHQLQDQIPAPMHYQHTVNVVAQSPPPPRAVAPHPYVYAVHHQLMAPVAHVPIGAAHYAHLPPSIWGPAHAQYHHAPPSHPHQGSLQGVTSPLHVQVHPSHHHAASASHMHHIATQPSAPHLYPHAVAQAGITQHAVHPHGLHSPHQYAYQYAHVQQAPPPTASQAAKEHRRPGAHRDSTANQYALVSSHARAEDDGAKTLVKQEGSVTPDHDTTVKHPAGNAKAAAGSDEKGATRERGSSSFSPVHKKGSSSASRLSSPKRAQSGRVTPKDEGMSSDSLDMEPSSGGSQRQRSPQTPGQPARKPRKPYTITKSREVWTPEEHGRFLHALQLYDRDWKKIEAYIGTKTVLQIRSHAQKHFGKVTKYKTGEYIPPPRPKKRATLPYPRSRSSAGCKSGSGSGGSCSDSCAGTETGITSGSGSLSESVNGGIGKGNSSDRLPSLSLSPRHDDHHANVRTVHSPPRSHTPQRRARPSAIHRSENAMMHSSKHPYYNSSPSRSYQRQELPRLQGLPSNMPESQQMHKPPTWQGSAVHPSAESRDQNLGLLHGKHAGGTHALAGNGLPENSDKINRDLSADRTPTHIASQNDVSRDAAQSSENAVSESPEASQRTRFFEKASLEQKNVREDIGRISGPNNSLLVLSHCVDMMAKDAPPDRQPAAGWAMAAAARRAHRAKVIRARKPPLPSPPTHSQPDAFVVSKAPSSRMVSTEVDVQEAPHPRRDAETPGSEKQLEELDRDSSAFPVPCPGLPEGRGRSPPTVSQDDANRPISQDPQRSSAGSGSSSDDAIAGFSSSDRPSVSDMGGSSGGSGSGGSLANSDTGEEDPKSSNDGSGDDGRSPSTRGSSPAEPASSGSRENTPNGNANESDGNETTNPQLRERSNGNNPEPHNSAQLTKAVGGSNLKNAEKMRHVVPQTTIQAARGPQAISNLCNATTEVCDMPLQAVEENKKRGRSAVSDGPGLEKGNGNADALGEPAKRKRHSVNGTVEALLNHPTDHDPMVRNASFDPEHSSQIT